MQTPKDLNDLRLYLITDRSLFKDQKYFLTAVEAALIGGVKALQLREKDLSDSEKTNFINNFETELKEEKLYYKYICTENEY